MLPYFLLLIIPLIVFIFENSKRFKSKINNKTVIAFFIILLIILCLRDISCGTDLKTYSYFFKTLSNLSIKNVINIYGESEVGFFLLTKLISIFSKDFQIYLSIIALISLIPIAIFYKKESRNSILTILLFVSIAPFSMFFSGLRQIIAMSIMIISFKFVREKKLLKFILIILFASLFHSSAIVTLVIYPIYHARITKKWLLFIIPIMIMIFVFNKQIFSFAIQFSNPLYIERYNVIESTGGYSILLMLILFSFICFIIPDNKKLEVDIIGLRNILLLTTCIQCFVPINSTIMRLNYYFLLFIPILIPKILSISSKEYKSLSTILSFVMVLFFTSYFYYNAYTGNDILNVFPYIPFWKG